MAKKLLIGLSVVLCLSPLLATAVAVASPGTYQRFAAQVGPPGSLPGPGPVPLALRFFQEVGLAGGPMDADGLNTGSVLESPAFATVFAYIWLPKEIKISLGAFPACREKAILDSPGTCPAGSEVGKPNPGGVDPVTGRERCFVPGQPDQGLQPCTAYAAGLLRARVSSENPSVAGRYLVTSGLTLRMFNVARKKDGRPLGDTLGLRVFSPGSGNILVEGRISKVGGRDIRRFGSAVRAFHRKIRFEIPSGLIEPVTGSVSQLTDFRAELKRTSRAGRPLVKLGRCPRGGKVPFAYSADYNSNLDTGNVGLGTSSAANGRYSINQVGSVTLARAPCKS